MKRTRGRHRGRRWGAVASVALIVLVVGSGFVATRLLGDKAVSTVRSDRQVLQSTMASLGGQYLLFGFQGESVVASTGSWSLTPGSAADTARLRQLSATSPLANYAAAVVSLSGQVLSRYQPHGGIPPASDPGFAPLRAALLAGRPGLSSVMVYRGVPLVASAVPIVVGGTPKALVVGYTRLGTSRLERYVASLHQGKAGMAYLVDSNGTVVAGPRRHQLGQHLSAGPALRAVRAGHSGIATYRQGSGEMVASYAPLGIGGWAAVTVQASAELQGPLQAATWRVEVTLVLLLLVASGAVVLFNRRRLAALAGETDSLRDLVETREQLRLCFEESPVGMALVDLVDEPGRIVEHNPALRALSGRDAATLSRSRLQDLVDPRDSPLLAQAHQSLLDAETSAYHVELRGVRADGEEMWLQVTGSLLDPGSGGPVRHGLAHLADVTDRKRAEAELTRQALHDGLTGLANRTLFRDRLDQALARAKRAERPVAVLLLDLDGFKSINDGLGHSVGDEVLVEVAARVLSCVRPGDTVARLGGDEFTVLLEGAADADTPSAAAARITAVLGQPITVRGQVLGLTGSVGIAVSAAGETADDLIRNADMAMYAAKSGGGGRHARFESFMHTAAQDHLSLAADLRQALRRRQMLLHYQPSLCLADGQLQGAEALLRWQHPERGLLAPNLFIPLAERTGEIVPLGRWVLEQACEQAVTWQRADVDGRPFAMSVNVSGRQLQTAAFVPDVAAILAATGLDPSSLVIEITESILMDDVEGSLVCLKALKALGVTLAIDDFGTGYSSLAYLRRFPIDILKIDKSFVDAATTDKAGGEALIKAIIELGASLALTTVAEGVEQPAQADRLHALGCHSAQGFLYAHPMPPGTFTEFLLTGDHRYRPASSQLV